MAQRVFITPKQRAFADAYVTNGGNATQAVKDIYGYTDKQTAAVYGSQTLRRPLVQSYLASKGERAGTVIEDIVNKSKKEDIKLKGAIYIHDYVYGKAMQRVETSSINLNIDYDKLTDNELDDLINNK